MFVSSYPKCTLSADLTATLFRQLLKQLRKRGGMTQGDLAAAVGYSVSFVSVLEQNRRLPDVDAVLQVFVPALGLLDEPHLATRLVELAASARGTIPNSDHAPARNADRRDGSARRTLNPLASGTD